MSQQSSLLPLDEELKQTTEQSNKTEALKAESRVESEKPKESYHVLARKYRPVNFTQLIGQDAMVRTLDHAFARNRMPHAIMLTGMRGVGKTTTARIIARALNYRSSDGKALGTIQMEEMTSTCRDILESRHPDVIEMDAASRTGISDIREIIDNVAYRPVIAQKKVYIIDEVHMLSTAAFNGLLKTLEEPPDHVTFIFATTEIRKVPVTVLSRCQRFDLRRLTLEETETLLNHVLTQEQLEAEAGALLLLARAAEGSARDALSLLDQAISHSDNKITELDIQDMLGLAGRSELLDLFDHLIGGEPLKALENLQQRFNHGVDPLLVLSDCCDLTHFLTRCKLAGESAEDYKLASGDRARAHKMAEGLTLESLTMIWQILLKGLEEARFAPDPYKATEMVMIRLAHVRNLPSLETLASKLDEAESAQTSDLIQQVFDHFPGAQIIAKKE